MYFKNLNKKLFSGEVTIEPKKRKELLEKHDLTDEELNNTIVHDLYQKFVANLTKTIPAVYIKTDEGNEIFNVSGYCISEIDMCKLIKEIFELDSVMKTDVLKEINEVLNIINNKK